MIDCGPLVSVETIYIPYVSLVIDVNNEIAMKSYKQHIYTLINTQVYKLRTASYSSRWQYTHMLL